MNRRGFLGAAVAVVVGLLGIKPPWPKPDGKVPFTGSGWGPPVGTPPGCVLRPVRPGLVELVSVVEPEQAASLPPHQPWRLRAGRAQWVRVSGYVLPGDRRA